jgi:hypothetical protein
MAGCHGRAKFFKHAQSLRPFYRLCSASIRISDKAKIFTWGYLRLIFRAAATPVGCWHVHVHNDYVWLEFVYSDNGFFAGFCLANQFDVWIVCEDLFENPSDQGFIVDD